MYGKENDQTHGSDVYFCNKKARNIWMSFRFTPLSNSTRDANLDMVLEFDNGVNRKLIHMFLAFLLQKYTSLPCVWSFSLPYIYKDFPTRATRWLSKFKSHVEGGCAIISFSGHNEIL